ncbi:DsbA family protein [soil metagenome]
MTDDLPAAEAAPAPAKSALQQWVSGRSVLALIVAVVALGFAAAPWVNPDLFGSRVRAYLLTHPEVLDEAQNAYLIKQQTERITAVNAAVAAHPAALRPAAGEPVFGPADAKVTVVEFFDYQCPYCKASTPDFLRLMQANPDVRFVFKEWPILDHNGKTTSQYAAQAALAAHAQGKYIPVHRALMAQEALTSEDVDRILAENGVTGPVTTPDAARIITNVRLDAIGIGIECTPTFFINGVVSPTHDPAKLAEIINAAKAR